MDYHLSQRIQHIFLKVVFALTMMFNCKDLSHWPVDIIVHFCPPHLCWMETTVNKMEKYSDDQIENFVEQILMKDSQFQLV